MVLVGNRLDEFGRHDGLHHKLVAFHLAHGNAVLDDVVEEEQTRLVTIDEHPLALVVLARHTYAVSIGVGSHHNVGIQLLCQRNSHRQGFGIFRIRRYHRGEVTVLHHLLRHTVYVLKAPHLE